MLWQKSPQYAGMPHDQYMQTDEGKRSQQAFQQWGQWQKDNIPTPSKPGPGRPSVPMMQTYSPGQPGPAGGVTNRFDGSGWASDGTRIKPGGVGSAQPQYSPYANSTPYGQQPQAPQGGSAKPPSLSQYTSPGAALPGRFGGGKAPQEANEAGFQYPTGQQQLMNRYGPGTSPGYMAGNQDTSGFNPTANRPPPFQATTQNFDGTQSQMPNFQQRDAFISQINNQLGQMQQQSWQQPGMGAPQFNFPQMWGQAGQMAQQGFQNPFAQQPDGGDQIRQLLGGQQGRMMSQDAWGQMYPGSPYPSSPGGVPAGASMRGAQGDIIPSAIGRPLINLPPGAIADGPPTARAGGSVNQDSAPRGSALPEFNRPVLKAPGSPGDPSPPVTPGAAAPQQKPPGRRMNLNPYTNADAPPGQRFNKQAFEDAKRSLLDAAAAAGRAGNRGESAELRARADDLQARREIFRAEAEDDVVWATKAANDYGAAVRRKDRELNPQNYRPPEGGSSAGGFDYAAAAREHQAKQRAAVAANNKIPVAQRNKWYGSDANRRSYESMM